MSLGWWNIKIWPDPWNFRIFTLQGTYPKKLGKAGKSSTQKRPMGWDMSDMDGYSQEGTYISLSILNQMQCIPWKISMEHTNQPIVKDHHLPFTSIFVFKIILNTPWKISMEHTNQPIVKDHHLPFTSIFVFKIILNTPWKISMEHTNQPIVKDHHLPFTSIFVLKN